MFIDAPLYNTNTPVMYVVARTASSLSKNPLPNKLGVCDEIRANSSHSVRPIFDAEDYFLKYKKGPAVAVWDGVQLRTQMDTVIEVVTPPKHGSLTRYQPDAEADDLSKYDYLYTPDKDYRADNFTEYDYLNTPVENYEEGLDNFEFLVSRNGEKLHVYYQVKVFPEDMNQNYIGFCNWEKYYWKISSTTTDPQSIIANFSNIQINFAPLSGGAIGATSGTVITLDTNAAGHGWFTNPQENWLNALTTAQDTNIWLPTSNANEWVARIGSAADGKMDMLSVLWHEMGHALGLDHSNDGHDLMATTKLTVQNTPLKALPITIMPTVAVLT